ncbi:hypothetical protein HDV01_003209 [Terramyces sp. JEL0728]|nr:hypothetical protein HDV01_003209 [Terramyces sp. JEL0728]
MILLLITLAKADQLIEGAYFAKDCVGPPDTLYVFETVNTYNYISWSPDLNETWPPYFKFHSDEVSVYDTGLVYVSIPGESCIVTTNYPSSKPYWSGYVLFYDGDYGLDAIPKVADGTSYCYLVSNDFNTTTNLNGYLAAYFRPNNNVCYDDSYKCFTNGTFQYFSGTGCSGSVETVSLTPDLLPLISANLGNVSVQFYKVQDATVFFSWLLAIPVESLVPKFDIPMDYVSLVAYILSLAIGLYVLYNSIAKAKSARKILFSQIITIISALFWLLNFVLSVTFWALTVTDFGIISWLSEWISISMGVASFCSCHLTSFLVSEVLFHHKKELLRIINPIALALIHFGLFGGAYFNYFADIGGYPMSFINPILEWDKYIIYWTVFMYAFNSVVPVLVAVKILYLSTGGKSVRNLNIVDPYLKYYILGQFLSFAVYATVFYIKKYSTLLYSDFVELDMGAISTFTYSVHAYLTGQIYLIILKSSRHASSAGTHLSTGTKETSSSHIAPSEKSLKTVHTVRPATNVHP